jgi:hypothetical protein
MNSSPPTGLTRRRARFLPVGTSWRTRCAPGSPRCAAKLDQAAGQQQIVDLLTGLISGPSDQ